jgi:hypothetical protein
VGLGAVAAVGLKGTLGHRSLFSGAGPLSGRYDLKYESRT